MPETRKHPRRSCCSMCLLRSGMRLLVSFTLLGHSASGSSTLTNNEQTAYLADCWGSLADGRTVGRSWGANACCNDDFTRFNQIALVYNQLRPNHYHQFLKMDICEDLWLLQSENDLFGQEDFDYEMPSQQQQALNQETVLLQTNYLLSYHSHLQPNAIRHKKAPPCLEPLDEECTPLSSAQNCFSSINCLSSDSEPKAGKKSKPSPYHNYQKHLNQALKHLIVLPALAGASEAMRVAHQLWGVFLSSRSSTKKIFHFVFNEFNEYRFKQADLKEFGLEEIYAHRSAQVLAEARTLLTNLAVEQMDEENIDSYLQTRRIKSPQKFKRYMLLFRQQLQDGFLKKRFTNLSRKEQYRKELMRSAELMHCC